MSRNKDSSVSEKGKEFKGVRLKEYTDFLTQLLDCFDFNVHGWPEVVITDEDCNVGRAMVGEELADLLTEVREGLEDNGDY